MTIEEFYTFTLNFWYAMLILGFLKNQFLEGANLLRYFTSEEYRQKYSEWMENKPK